jgi:urea carboxylase
MRVEVVTPGTQTTVQDWPGRVGFWEAGVPPSGPMDDRSFRIGNHLVGNPEGAAGLEVTLSGPALRFSHETVVAVTGAVLPVSVDGAAVPQWAPVTVPAGATLKLGAVRGAGLRAYVLVRGGLDGEMTLGSRAAFGPGGLGAGGGRALTAGAALTVATPNGDLSPVHRRAVRPPAFSNTWTLRVVPGPHGAPDFFTEGGLVTLLGTQWRVHHQSDRTGVRLSGPVPQFARTDGGEAGLHPSNILDSAYGVGTIMLAGDMAVIVGPDGPSLGGFTAIGQVIAADLWCLGQLRAQDVIALQVVGPGEAAAARRSAREQIADLDAVVSVAIPVTAPRTVVLDGPRDGSGGLVTFRRAGERALLVEFGEPVLDLRSRVRAHALQAAVRDAELPAITDLTPGVRSLHVQYDPDAISAPALLSVLSTLEAGLDDPETLEIAGRVVHLPLAWRHSQAELAVQRYGTTVRRDAPWCPDNIEFIRRMNGLDSEDAVQQIVLDASYLVLGLGDVYLGAPVAVPLDPRHRLVTTKYNPARTWTPANAVGIGGAFLCVYGVEGPGGYQLVGRTVPIWDTAADTPWQLRHFDQLRFHLVGEERLEEQRRLSRTGEWAPETAPVTFSLREHAQFLEEHADAIAVFRATREAAFEDERQAWAAPAAAGVTA